MHIESYIVHKKGFTDDRTDVFPRPLGAGKMQTVKKVSVLHKSKPPLCKGRWATDRWLGGVDIVKCDYSTFLPIKWKLFAVQSLSHGLRRASSLKVNCPKGKRNRPGPLHKGALRALKKQVL